jgi:glycosyltransferase involved in cell wall biosynthesis
VTSLSYGIVTPALNEENDLGRLASCLAEQTAVPTAWIIVDQGSIDGTKAIAESLANQHPWVRLLSVDDTVLARGAPIVRAFHAGLVELVPVPDVIAKVDADVSVKPDHFQRLLEAFSVDRELGVASGIVYERQSDGVWRQRHGTGSGVWGACRAYRRECLADLLPLEEHMGWDGLDLAKAAVRGWRTRVLLDLPFRHHRREGIRDGSRLRTWVMQGEASHFMGYRVSYLMLRAIYRMARDPAAVGLLAGYARAAARRRPRCDDPEVRAYVRNEQSIRRLPLRAREARRPRAALNDRS